MFKSLMNFLHRKPWLKKNPAPLISIPQTVHKTVEEIKHVYGPRRIRFKFLLKEICRFCNHSLIILRYRRRVSPKFVCGHCGGVRG